ncbi:MAG: hypothetical protein M0R50_03205 [Candidatus Cloacimonetes bacterium]|jgi:hypothetical protein|nr:hypothetical protein [Candidatus Cloacimonadota bacterium]
MYHYNFTINTASAAAGAIYSNNGQTFTVVESVVNGTILVTHGSGVPSSSGTLTLISGSGTDSIIFSSTVNLLLPDNRLRFTAPLIDFANDVGLSGQDHEKFPAPDAQPRYDWLLMWYISLLANQSSYDEPTQYRDGTFWFDLNTLTIKLWRSSLESISGSWMSLASSISLEVVSGVPLMLDTWYASASAKLTGSAPVITFGGYVTLAEATEIPVPVTLQGEIDLNKTRPFVYINGILVDPRNCEYYTATTIKLLNDVVLVANDRFTVVIQNILPANFSIPDVVI